MTADTPCVMKPITMDSTGQPASQLGRVGDRRLWLQFPVNGGGVATTRALLTPLGERFPGDEVLIATGQVDAEGRSLWELFEVAFPMEELRVAS
ncbi:uncharacterized protein CMC5_079390 [Chondromyces crocatus]|uniref:Uncharacterized protein n=2 Tax=Chondromyces crocatus TaxID=52 RepID=A0A0K1ESD6_CHOCO|nr:uncharacterized protein CMC5_079390 [Chondromyces crocatus]